MGRNHSYQPMHPPEKPVSQERMNAILAARTNTLAAHLDPSERAEGVEVSGSQSGSPRPKTDSLTSSIPDSSGVESNQETGVRLPHCPSGDSWAKPVKPPDSETPIDEAGSTTAKSIDSGGSVPPAVTLQWTIPEPLSRLITTECGRYRVRKWSGTETLTEAPEWRYQGEMLMEGRWYYRFGPICDSSAEVKRICEEHARAMGCGL